MCIPTTRSSQCRSVVHEDAHLLVIDPDAWQPSEDDRLCFTKPLPRFTIQMRRLSASGRGLLAMSIALSVYAVAAAEDRVYSLKREAAQTGAGGALAGFACGPGAPVCATIGASSSAPLPRWASASSGNAGLMRRAKELAIRPVEPATPGGGVFSGRMRPTSDSGPKGPHPG